MVLSQTPKGRLACVGHFGVGHPSHTPADISGNLQLLFLLLFASSAVSFLLFLRVRWASQACPVPMASLEPLAPR